MAFGMLTVLASPASIQTRTLLEQNWPELGDIVIQKILNTQEYYAVQEEALCFLLSATMWSTGTIFRCTPERNSPPAGFERIDSLGINAALERYNFWGSFPGLLEESGGTPGSHCALLDLILNLSLSDMNFVKAKICVNPHVFEVMIDNLDSGDGKATRCLHSPSIYSIKAYKGQILCILERQEDLQIQSMIRDE
jgi:hypothetical protein